MSKSIEISNLIHRYPGTDFNALHKLNLSIDKGEIFGLFGPNGAGKTTLISILTGLLKIDIGTVKIQGMDLRIETEKIKTVIGVVPQEYAIYPKLTARENLQFFGSMYGVPRKDLNRKIDSGIAKMGLTKFANNRIETFSGGMKRRINLLAGILHEPNLIFLDEPTVGVDVHSKRFIIDFLKKMNEKGTTIVYSSHILHEAQEFCSRVAIIDNGEIQIEGNTQDVLLDNGEFRTLEEIFIETIGADRVHV
ncbi:MAG: ABC transporter ATP-binding protein [Brumimicrobium sp.]